MDDAKVIQTQKEWAAHYYNHFIKNWPNRVPGNLDVADRSRALSRLLMDIEPGGAMTPAPVPARFLQVPECATLFMHIKRSEKNPLRDEYNIEASRHNLKGCLSMINGLPEFQALASRITAHVRACQQKKILDAVVNDTQLCVLAMIMASFLLGRDRPMPVLFANTLQIWMDKLGYPDVAVGVGLTPDIALDLLRAPLSSTTATQMALVDRIFIIRH